MRLLIALFLIPSFCFAQIAGKSRLVSNGGVLMYWFRPGDSTAGIKHPLIIQAKGSTEAGTLTSTPNSIGAYCKAGASMRFYNAKRGAYTTYTVLELVDNPDTNAIKNAVTWAKANIPDVDTTQMYYFGLSLSGGRAAEIAYSAGGLASRFTATVGCSPIYNVGAYQVLPVIPTSGIILYLVDATNDYNTNTQWVAQQYRDDPGWVTCVPQPKLYFPTSANGWDGHAGGWIMGMDTLGGTRTVDSSGFPGHSNAAASISYTPILQQVLAFDRAVGASPTVGSRVFINPKRSIRIR